MNGSVYILNVHVNTHLYCNKNMLIPKLNNWLLVFFRIVPVCVSHVLSCSKLCLVLTCPTLPHHLPLLSPQALILLFFSQ